jgi:hypothetical protein
MMNHMFGTRYLSMDAPEGSAAPTEGSAPAQPAAAPVEQSAPAPAPADMVSRSEFSSLQEQLGRAEGRAKQSQRLSSIAEQYGYRNLDDLADALQSSNRQSDNRPSNYYSQADNNQQFQQEAPRSQDMTTEMIDQRINHQIGRNEAISSHNLGREAEGQLIAQLLGSKDFAPIFEGIDAGDYGSVFDAAFSGSGSAAAEIVASAIDNAIYGNTQRYGDDSPDQLRGKSMPLKDSGAFEKVQGRVLEGLKELAAMSVFAASKQGMTDSVPDQVEGEEIELSEIKERRSEQIKNWAQKTYEDELNVGNPSSQ